ncbi:arginine--tRNA ligase, partial [Candidatus Giovannonibacteria bacterium]|nr:arginine--tRNA ligase [Candidatus Giovannonibacteria bacterium]
MLRDILKGKISKIIGEDADFKISEPERAEFGDFSTNVAFLLAKKMANPPAGGPQEIADELAAKLLKSSKIVSKAEAQNGFLNIFLKDKSLLKELGEEVKFPKKKERINAEFVSANPTGPLTMANARGGFLGDALSNVLEKTGYDVTREFYINDA